MGRTLLHGGVPIVVALYKPPDSRDASGSVRAQFSPLPYEKRLGDGVLWGGSPGGTLILIVSCGFPGGRGWSERGHIIETASPKCPEARLQQAASPSIDLGA